MTTQVKPLHLLKEKPQPTKLPSDISSTVLSKSTTPTADLSLGKVENFCGLFKAHSIGGDEKESELLAHLMVEVDKLVKKGLPQHVAKISKPYIPSHQLNSENYIVPSTEINIRKTVVLIEVSLSPKSPDGRLPLYKHGLRATLQFDKSYIDDLNLPPMVWFQTPMSHPFVEPRRLNTTNWANMFFKWFISNSKNAEDKVNLLAVLEYLNIFLFLFEKDISVQMLNYKYHIQLNSDAIVDAYKQHQAHQELFQTPWPDDFFHAEFLKHFRENSLKDLAKEIHPEVFTFPIFSNKLCSAIEKEMFNYQDSGLPVKRPNSMNNYGLILNSIGLEPSIKWLQENYLLPVAKGLFRNRAITSRFDSHHSFIVHYQPGKDLGLDMHTDDSDITFNVCLGKEFEGAALNFCGVLGQPDHRQFKTAYYHVKGHCIVHLGTQRHGACEITSGERLNLIIWNKNHIWGESKDYEYCISQRTYNKETAPPDLRCLSYTHDKDYIFFKKKLPDTVDKKKIKQIGWCPPQHAWYDEYAKTRKMIGLK